MSITSARNARIIRAEFAKVDDMLSSQTRFDTDLPTRWRGRARITRYRTYARRGWTVCNPRWAPGRVFGWLNDDPIVT